MGHYLDRNGVIKTMATRNKATRSYIEWTEDKLVVMIKLAETEGVKATAEHFGTTANNIAQRIHSLNKRLARVDQIVIKRARGVSQSELVAAVRKARSEAEGKR